jgi:hypothetical protein
VAAGQKHDCEGCAAQHIYTAENEFQHVGCEGNGKKVQETSRKRGVHMSQVSHTSRIQLLTDFKFNKEATGTVPCPNNNNKTVFLNNY